MSIQDDFNKINPQLRAKNPNNDLGIEETVTFDENGKIQSNSKYQNIFIPILIILVSTLSFGLGRLSGDSIRPGIKIELDKTYSTSTGAYLSSEKIDEDNPSSVPLPTPTSSIVVGSIKGTKYHYLHCSGAKQISEANKITFQNAALAEAAGYTLALNCKNK